MGSGFQILWREGQETEIRVQSARWWKTRPARGGAAKGEAPSQLPLTLSILQDDSSRDARRFHE